LKDSKLHETETTNESEIYGNAIIGPALGVSNFILLHINKAISKMEKRRF